MEESRIVLRIVPGHREVLGFCTEARLEQIGQYLQPILGRRVRVTLQQPERADAQQPSGPSTDDRSAARTTSNQRQQAMNLPLVQRALETFPDATFIDARDDNELPPPPAQSDDANETDTPDDEPSP